MKNTSYFYKKETLRMRFSPSLLIRLSWGVLTVLSASGCGKTIISGMGPMTAQAAAAIAAYDDPDLLGKALPNNLITDEGYLGIAPDNVDLLVGTASTYSLYAAAFVEEIDQEHAKKLYLRGRELGLRALEQNPRFKKAVEQGSLEAFAAALESFKKKDVPALFWTAFNWAGWINLHRDDPAAVVDVPRVQALVERVLSLEPDFYAGSAHVLRGVLAVTRPKMLGGDPELAEQEFQRALAAAPDYLMTRVLHAQYVARQANDAAQFKKDLDETLAADVAKMPSQRLANELAKRRAKLLLGMQKSLF